MIDWSISIGNIVTMAVTMVSAIVILFTFINKWSVAFTVIGGRMDSLERIVTEQTTELKEIRKTLVIVAQQDIRITTLDDRINAIQQTRDEWRTQVATRLLDITGALAKLYNEQGETLRRVDEFMAGK
jgi:hypothetical protein